MRSLRSRRNRFSCTLSSVRDVIGARCFAAAAARSRGLPRAITLATADHRRRRSFHRRAGEGRWSEGSGALPSKPCSPAVAPVGNHCVAHRASPRAIRCTPPTWTSSAIGPGAGAQLGPARLCSFTTGYGTRGNEVVLPAGGPAPDYRDLGFYRLPTARLLVEVKRITQLSHRRRPMRVPAIDVIHSFTRGSAPICASLPTCSAKFC